MVCLPVILVLAMLQAVAPVAQPKVRAWLDPDRGEPAGTHYRTFPSTLAGGEVSYLIYLPPDYQTAPQRRYPVVYWLHGRGGTPQKGAPFVRTLNDNILAGKAPAMIAVLVNGLRDSLYVDSPDGKWPVESVIIRELIPHIDRTYRTIARRDSRSVEGFSMGGYGAAHLGFKYPELFGMVGVMAGALVDCGFFMPDSSHSDVAEKLCGSDRAYWQENHPFTLLRKNADRIRGRTEIRVAVGDRDGLQRNNQALHELLVELKIDHEYEVVPGIEHERGRLYGTLGERAFAWYQRALRRTTSPDKRVTN